MTDVERLIRDSFAAEAGDTPDATGLAEAARNRAKHDRVRILAAAGAAVCAAGIVAAVAIFGPGGSDSPENVAGETGPGTAQQLPAPISEAIHGEWLPTEIAGFDLLAAEPQRDPATVTFEADGKWTGSDGCNGLGGTYTVGEDGSFSAESGPSTLIACDNVPNAEVLVAATKVELTDGKLYFYDAAGQVVGTYGPA